MLAKISRLIVFFSLLFVACARADMTGAQLDDLMAKLIIAESSGGHWPRITGELGERGPMQISKETWERFSGYPWKDAYDADHNLQVGRMILERIADVYGAKATPARVAFTYNTGLYAFGRLPAWTKRHPNRIYREIFS